MKTKIAQFFLILAAFILTLAAGRFYFLVKYSEAYANAGAGAVALSFIQGLRFDLATASLVTAPVFLVLYLPGVSRIKATVNALIYLLLGWYSALIIYNFIDIHYYAFAQRHLTFEIGNALGDTDSILKIGFSRYIFEVIGIFAFLAAFGYGFLRLTSSFRKLTLNGGQTKGLKGVVFDTGLYLLVIALTLVFVRGGLQMKPLSIKNAFMDERVELGALSLNGIYTTLNTFYNTKDIKTLASIVDKVDDDGGPDNPLRLFDPEREAFDPEYPLFKRLKTSGRERPLNVVVFLMESWTAKYIGSLGGRLDAAPFFSKLSDKGLLLTNCYANGQRSYEGASALLGSLPSWSGMSLDKGGLLYQTRLEPLGSILKKRGYETFFIHAAKPGSMGFDGLAKKAGLDRYISRDDFGGLDRIDDGVWGVYDEYAFQRAHEEFEALNKAGRTFYGVVYSLTSHTPYKVPSKEFERFGKDIKERDFLNSMIYSDYALEKFFEKASKSGYAENTLFVILGDHTEGFHTADNLRDSYRIPCLFHAPGAVEPGRFEGVASQVDIMPTIIDMLRIPDPYTSWGRSILAGGSGRALLPRGDMVVWVNGKKMFLTDLAAVNALYDTTKEPGKNVLAEGNTPNTDEAMRMRDELLKYLKLSSRLITENRVMPR